MTEEERLKRVERDSRHGSLWKAFGVFMAVLLVLAWAWGGHQDRERDRQDKRADVARERQDARSEAALKRETQRLVRHMLRSRIEAEMGICERLKSDRKDSARAFTAIALYLEERLVSGALSRREKILAARAFKQTHESANQMRLRLWLCGPLIRENREESDRSAQREARGEL